MSRGSAVVSPDGKYAVIIPGDGKDSENSVAVMDGKTLGIQGRVISSILRCTKTICFKIWIFSADYIWLLINFTVVKRQSHTSDKSPFNASRVRWRNTVDWSEWWNIYDTQLWDINNLDDDSGEDKLPCLNCSLIQQGSAISYADNRCPQCGEDAGL